MSITKKVGILQWKKKWESFGWFLTLTLKVKFWHSQAEEERIACKAEQIHKMTTIFTQNKNLGPFLVKLFVTFF